MGGWALHYGRRRTLLAAGIPLSFCWIMTIFAVNVELLCCSSFISGFLVSVVQIAAQVYVSEIAAPSIRGGLNALLKISGHLGNLLAFIAGAFCSWRQLAGLISLAPAAMCIAMWNVPESPGWLVLEGKTIEAETSLRWLRRSLTDLDIAKLQCYIHANKVKVNTTKLLRSLRNPLLITCGLMFFQRFSGVNSFNFYVVEVFKETFDSTNPHMAAIAVAVVQLLSSILSCLLVDTAGRLPLLVASSVLMSLALACFGSFAYYEKHIQDHSSNMDWIPLLCALIFTVAFSLGISPISWLLVSEMFTLETRGIGTALATCFSYLCAFIGVKIFVDFEEVLGLHGAFWLYAFLSLCGLGFIVCFVPETKGQNLADVDAISWSYVFSQITNRYVANTLERYC